MESKSKSAAGMVTASAKKKSPMKHKFRKIEIEPAENGFTMKHHLPHEEMKEDKEGMMRYNPMPEPSTKVFNNADEMMDHISGLVGAKKNAKSGEMKPEDKKDMGKNDKEDEPDEDDE